MNSKVTHYIIAGLFVVSAAVQYNDPDPWLWILIYGSVALVAIVKTQFPQVNFGPLIITLLLILTFYAFTFIPSVIDFWNSSNKSDLVGKMKAEDPWIEGAREFGGLIIAVIALSYLKRSKIK